MYLPDRPLTGDLVVIRPATEADADLLVRWHAEEETSAGPLARTGGGTASAARAAVLLATVGLGSFILAGSRRRRSTRSPAA
jgi:hypothetical protein